MRVERMSFVEPIIVDGKIVGEEEYEMLELCFGAFKLLAGFRKKSRKVRPQWFGRD